MGTPGPAELLAGLALAPELSDHEFRHCLLRLAVAQHAYLGTKLTKGSWVLARRSSQAGNSDEMKAIGKFFRDNGLYVMIANNSVHTNPPLCINEDQLAEAFEIIDRGLEITDQAVTG